MSSAPADILNAVGRPDLTAPIVWLPVRHHSPACARHVGQVIRSLRPAAVLIEGPRDATPIISQLVDPDCIAPVAIFTTYTERPANEPIRRNAAYYPLCDYSPELVAIRSGHSVGAHVRFIDLTWPEMATIERAGGASKAESDHPQSLQQDVSLRRGSWLEEACRRAGARNPDDLWDSWFEADTPNRDDADFFRGVLAWCTACRVAHTAEDIAAEGHAIREAGMRAEINRVASEVQGQIVVVTGGFHTVALPNTAPSMPDPVVISNPDDAGTWLMRYDFLQLDRLNGYASGMPCPEFWQWRWEQRSADALLATIGRQLRGNTGSPSVADTAVAVAQLRQLSAYRHHHQPTLSDFFDAITSVFIKGSQDIEGVSILAQVRKAITGERIGKVPASVGRPPMVIDFERQAATLRLKLGADEQAAEFDLYRSRSHREASRFLHQLALLTIPFARKIAGPDFTQNTDLHRVREIWRYQWHPGVEARLVEQSRYGATIAEASATLLAELAESAQQGERRADRSAKLIVEACRCGLHPQARILVPQLVRLLADDSDVSSIIGAGENLHLLVTGREPLEAHSMPEIDDVILSAWTRAAYLITDLGQSNPEGEVEACQDLLAWASLADSLDEESCAALRTERLVDVSAGNNPAVSGTAFGLLYDEGRVDGATLGRQLAGHVSAASTDPSVGGRFLGGVLRAARSACWSEPAIIDAIHLVLQSIDESHFIASLPHLRLAFSELPPKAIDHVAQMVAERAGISSLDRHRSRHHTIADVHLGRASDRLVREALARDGLLTLAEKTDV